MNQPNGHVLLFVKWLDAEKKRAVFYEAAPFSKTLASERDVNEMTAAGYQPLRYRTSAIDAAARLGLRRNVFAEFLPEGHEVFFDRCGVAEDEARHERKRIFETSPASVISSRVPSARSGKCKSSCPNSRDPGRRCA